MRVVVTGGGTGGHIYPGLAILRELCINNPGTEVLYVGTATGLEADIIPKEGIPFQTISSRGFQRKLSMDTLKTILVAGKGFFEAGSILHKFKPNIVVGTGGYVAGPMVLQASLLGIPTLIHEQNALPSLTNRLLARFVSAIAVSFPEAIPFFKTKAPVFDTGNPVRREIIELERSQAMDLLGLDSLKQTILIVGGSRGAEPINQAVLGLIPKILVHGRLQMIFVTGQRHYAEILQSAQCYGRLTPAIQIVPYLYQMPAGLKAADLIISRAGGMIAEIHVCGLPAIYVPSPHVADNHQEFNARAIEQKGAGFMVRECELTSEVLWSRIQEILYHPEQLQKMKRAAFSLAKPQAAEELAKLVVQISGQKGSI